MLRAARESGTRRAGRAAPAHRAASRQRDEVPQVRRGRRRGHGAALRAQRGGGPERPTPNSEPPERHGLGYLVRPRAAAALQQEAPSRRLAQFLDYANGTLGDWGVHWLDQVLWWSGEKYPKRVFCTGGRPMLGAAVLNDKEQTSDAPDHQVATSMSSRNSPACGNTAASPDNDAEKHKIGAYFLRHERHAAHRLARRLDVLSDRPRARRSQHEDSQLQEPDGHNMKLLWADFIAAIDERARKPSANIELAHRASVLPLLGMISWRTGAASSGTRRRNRSSATRKRTSC